MSSKAKADGKKKTEAKEGAKAGAKAEAKAGAEVGKAGAAGKAGVPAGYQYERDTWTVIDRCFADQPNYLAHNQLDSFNEFIESTIPVLIKKDCPIVIEHGWDPENQTHQIRYEVDFTNVYMSHPQISEGSGTVRALYPHEARHRNLTYSANLYIDVTHRLFKDGKLVDEKTESKIQFKIPAMVKSKICYLEKTEAQSLISMGECPYDKGGYFIINGSEKVIIAQERPLDNGVLCFPQKAGSKYDEIVEIRSTIDQRFYPVKNNIVCLTKTKDGEIEQYLRFGCPYLTKEVSLVMMFKAIGITSEKEICEMICMMDVETIPDDMAQLVTPSLEEMIDIDGTKRKVVTQHDALIYISRHVNVNMDYLVKKLGKNPSEQDKLLERNRYILDILRRDLLPHVGPDFRKKGLFLGYMAQRLIQVKLGHRLHDIRDHYANKRLDTAGPKLKQLFHGSFGRLIKEIKNRVGKALENNETNSVNNSLRKIIQNCTIEAPIKKALSTGDWSTNKNANFQSTTNLGIAQVLNRMSYIGYLSHIRRAMTPMEKAGGKITEPRKLHPSQNGYKCPNETPEGQQVGIVTNLSLMTTVTIATSVEALRMILKRLGIQSVDVVDVTKMGMLTKVFLNGEWMGVTTDALKVYNRLKELKRSRINPYMGIYWDHEQSEISVRTDGGRYTRPLYVVERYGNQWWPKIAMDWQSKKLAQMSWSDLIGNGYIEFVDPQECENCLIAMSYEMLRNNRADAERFYAYTHLEIHPSMWHGVVSQIIPLPDHNQSPRNCFMCLWKEEKVWMADNSWKKIGDIQVGEQVWCVDPDTKELTKSKVINQFVRDVSDHEKNMIDLFTKDGRNLKCTVDHPILTKNGWKEAGKLVNGDLISVIEDGGFIRKLFGYVEKNHKYVEFDRSVQVSRVEISDITVDSECHSFITGSGIVVHNSSMGKQALGLYATNFNSRFDTMANVLCFPNKPLVNTRTAKYVNLDKLPHGQQCVVAVACYTGYNQEDSVLMNKGSIERGKFNSIYFKTYVDEMNPHKSSTSESEQFGIPNPNTTQGRKHGSYDKLDESGFAKIGAEVEQDDVIIGKTVKLREPVKTSSGVYITHSDISSTVKQGDSGFVDLRIPSPGSVKNLNSDNNQFAKVRLAQYRRPVIGDKLACYSIDTEMLTDKGWKNVYDITKEDRVATLVDDERLVYANPTEIHEFDHSGPMLEVQSTLVDVCVTLNHRMYIKKRDAKKFTIMSAGDMHGKRVRFKRDAMFIPDEKKITTKYVLPGFTCKYNRGVVTFPDLEMDMDDWLTLLGIWLAEGWTNKSHSGGSKTSRDDIGATVIAANKPRVQEAIDKIDKKYNLGFTRNKKNMKWSTCQKNLYHYFKNLNIGAINKTLPDWIWDTLTQEQCQIFLHGLMLGDGHFGKTNFHHYFTSSWQLADQVQRLAFHAGWSANIKKRSEAGSTYKFKDHEGTTKADAFVVQIIKTKNNPQINHGHAKEKHDKIIEYEGKVYCVTVPSGIVYVRRNGKPVWCGNSRSAQKATIGLVVEEENMPFTDTGIVPDIVMNPHALPSRMTIAQTLECILGKNAALDAEFKDATPFTYFDQKEVGDALEKYGFQRDGEEVLYNGMTGEQLRVTLFIGPTYYQRLKHMVQDKVHARATGRVNNLTKQSVEGRGVGGGLRVGEMERDCLISHGTAQFQKERFMDSADKFRIFVGKKNHSIVVGNPDIDLFKYDGEDLNPEEVAEVQLPHAMKLLVHELMSMGTDIQLITDEEHK